MDDKVLAALIAAIVGVMGWVLKPYIEFKVSCWQQDRQDADEKKKAKAKANKESLDRLVSLLRQAQKVFESAVSFQDYKPSPRPDAHLELMELQESVAQGVHTLEQIENGIRVTELDDELRKFTVTSSARLRVFALESLGGDKPDRSFFYVWSELLERKIRELQ